MTEDITMKQRSPQSEPPLPGTNVTSQITSLLSLIIVLGLPVPPSYFAVSEYEKSPYFSYHGPQMRQKFEIQQRSSKVHHSNMNCFRPSASQRFHQ